LSHEPQLKERALAKATCLESWERRKTVLGEILVHDLDLEGADVTLAGATVALLVLSSLGVLLAGEPLLLALSDLIRQLGVLKILRIAQRFLEPETEESITHAMRIDVNS
jgi:hypothetical protein